MAQAHRTRCLIEPSQLRFSLGRTLLEFGYVPTPLVRLLQPPIQKLLHQLFRPLQFKQPLFDMSYDCVVQPIHGRRHALTSDLHHASLRAPRNCRRNKCR